MRTTSLAWAGAIAALAIVVGGQQAAAQEASGQYYGYPGKQGPVASGQGQHGYGCQVEKWGCQVFYCSPPPSCQNVHIPVPGLEAPSCQNPYVIVTEAAPPPPQTVTIYRNHYVPIKIVTQPTPVAPVNILVKWREIHYLCDCPPGSPQCPHLPSGQAKADDKTPAPVVADAAAGATPAAAPARPAPATTTPAQVTANPAPTAPEVAQQNTPPKRWVHLKRMGLYGFGYQRADGLWVVDPGSLRPTPPEGTANLPAQPTAPSPTVAQGNGGVSGPGPR